MDPLFTRTRLGALSLNNLPTFCRGTATSAALDRYFSWVAAQPSTRSSDSFVAAAALLALARRGSQDCSEGEIGKAFVAENRGRPSAELDLYVYVKSGVDLVLHSFELGQSGRPGT